VDISAALAADLAALTDSLGNPEIDLQTQLRAIAADLKRAVASYTGMTMTITLDGHDISFTTADGVDTAATETSLNIPLSALTAAQDDGSLVIYAATVGAFVDLAADLSFVLNIDNAALVLDEPAPHRFTATHDRPGMRGLDEFSRMNQAIGILISRGHTPETARLELHRLANLDGGHLHKAADAVLMSLTNRSGTPPP
jgi:hypothetical protein